MFRMKLGKTLAAREYDVDCWGGSLVDALPVAGSEISRAGGVIEEF